MGVLIFTGELSRLNIEVQSWLDRPRPRLLELLGLRPGAGRLDLLADRLDLLEALAVEVARADDPEAAGAELGVARRSGRPRISSQPSRSISNGFIRTSAAGNGQLRVVLVDRLRDRLEVLRLGDATIV